MNDRELDELQARFSRIQTAWRSPQWRNVTFDDIRILCDDQDAAIRDLRERLADKERRLHAWAVEANIAGITDGADVPRNVIGRLLNRAESAERQLKELAPTGKYEGLDIEGWFQQAQEAKRVVAQAEHKTVWVVSTKTFIQILDTEESAINFERLLGMDTGSLFVQPMEIPILHCDDPRTIAPEQPAPTGDTAESLLREWLKLNERGIDQWDDDFEQIMSSFESRVKAVLSISPMANNESALPKVMDTPETVIRDGTDKTSARPTPSVAADTTVSVSTTGQQAADAREIMAPGDDPNVQGTRSRCDTVLVESYLLRGMSPPPGKYYLSREIQIPRFGFSAVLDNVSVDTEQPNVPEFLRKKS